MFPVLENLVNNKVHGPVLRTFAEEKLDKIKFRKGSYLLRQSTQHYDKIFLHFCAGEGRRPEEMLIHCPAIEQSVARNDGDVDESRGSVEAGYRLEMTKDVYSLPPLLHKSFSSINDLVHAMKTLSSPVELLDCIHPSEFDKVESLLLCRTDAQVRE